MNQDVIMKAVVHVDNPTNWTHALSNLQNFLNLVPNADLILVANGDAITGYKNTQIKEKIAQLSNVKFHACRNSMNAHKMTDQDLPDLIEIVPAGIVDLTQLQMDGYAYVKP